METLEGRRLLATFAPYSLPATAFSITSGPDGNVWFASATGEEFGKVTPGGNVTTYATRGFPLYHITTGADGNLWMNSDTAILEATPSGKITTYPLPASDVELNAGRQLGAVTEGPNGNIWFTIHYDSTPAIGEITPTGAISLFPTGAAAAPEDSITEGADGNIWFPYASGGGIGKVTPSGQILDYTNFMLTGSSLDRKIYNITNGPDGDVWFLETVTVYGAGELELGSITPSGDIAEYPLAPSPNPLSGDGITYSSDGHLYVLENGQVAQVVFSTSGGPSTNLLGNTGSGMASGYNETITQGPDGNIWYLQASPDAIVKVVVTSPTATPTPTPPSTPTPTATTTPTPTPGTTPTPTSTSTPAPAPAPGQSLAPPQINAVKAILKRGRIKALQVIFEPSTLDAHYDPLDVRNAEDVGNYQLVALDQAKRSRGVTVEPVALASATYSLMSLPASTTYGPVEEVTLTLYHPVPKTEKLQLTVISSASAIVGVDGIPLDGTGDGQPGGNYVRNLD